MVKHLENANDFENIVRLAHEEFALRKLPKVPQSITLYIL